MMVFMIILMLNKVAQMNLFDLKLGQLEILENNIFNKMHNLLWIMNFIITIYQEFQVFLWKKIKQLIHFKKMQFWHKEITKRKVCRFNFK